MTKWLKRRAMTRAREKWRIVKKDLLFVNARISEGEVRDQL